MADRSELAIQTLFRSRARIQCPAVVVVAIPNGALRGQKAMNQARREGAAWGFPDVICMWPGGGVAFIEFKSATGRLDANQVEWQTRLASMGFKAVVSRDPDHALAFLKELGAPFLCAKPIGDVVKPLLEHITAATELQSVLQRTPTAAGRKKLIMAAWEVGAIDDGQCSLLIESMGLETA